MLVAAGAAPPGWSQNWTPDAATIAKLEASIKPGDIPRWGNAHAPVVADYAPYYSGTTETGERFILAEFVVADIDAVKPGIYIVRDRKSFPEILDGGCGVVNIVYSVKSGRIVSLVCNGWA
ncbi:MAG TPA: hypothetical protein VGU23_01965 [Acidobacteriaceae bacterium]|nr:hypothetical protein [Acidobacteriaceae bacterium]